jgi:hypothetical protein
MNVREMGLVKKTEKFPPEMFNDRRRLSSKRGPRM